VLQVLPSSLLGAVFGLVCHNAHKQQAHQITRMKCMSQRSSKDKTKRPSFAAPFWIHFEPRFEPVGQCVLFIQAPQAENKRPRGSFAAIPMTKIRAIMSAQMAVLGDLNLDSSHLRRPMQCKTSAIRDPIQPHVQQSKAFDELSR
jgi:hypothetical protein